MDLDIPEEWAKMYANRKDERTVEYPFVWRKLHPPEAGWKTILDVGCCESGIIEVLASLDYVAFGIDIRCWSKISKREPRFIFVKGDIRDTYFPDGFFDQITCISTVEHIGLNAYDNLWIDDGGDHKAMSEMHRILRDGGNLLLTVPFGNHFNDYWVRYYKSSTLRALLKGFKDVKTEFWMSPPQPDFGKWKQCTEAEAMKQGIEKGGLPLAVALVQASK